jgi:ABC-2 type transport system ATP-binding protein
VAAIRAHSLTKHYGRSRGVLDLDFAVAEGEVFGFLGPNGAGKTTTIRLLLDFIRPSSGRADVLGLDTRRDAIAIRRRIGYLPGDLRLYERLTGRQLLEYFGALRGLRGTGEAEELAERLDVELDRPIQDLSRGNRQKVGLLQAFMHRPDLLVLDEPTSGLDPLIQQVFHELVREAAAEERTVFLSSHNLAEVQHVADRVALVKDGLLVLVETVENLRARSFTRVEATFERLPPAGAFADLPGVRELERDGDRVVLGLHGPADPLVKALSHRDHAGQPRGRPRGCLPQPLPRGRGRCCVASSRRRSGTRAAECSGGRSGSSRSLGSSSPSTRRCATTPS